MSTLPRTTNFITPRALEDANIVMQWAKDYISSPHPQLGRDGTVCPFVLPSIQRGAFNISLHYGVDGICPDTVREVLVDHSQVFLDLPPTEEPDKIYKTILAVFPDIPEERGGILDEVHAGLKDHFVCNGMMIGQFHKRCLEPAARNPDFLISTSPIPLVAIRYMSIHDILFLTTRKDWFLEYARRFSCRYDEGKVTSATYKELFYKTKAVFAGEPV